MCLEHTDHRNPQSYSDIVYNVVPKHYTEVYMDITNKCNAMCPYCVTGKNNLTGKSRCVPPYYMTAEEFRRLHEHLLSHDIIVPDCIYRIYSWYEPSLNPHLPEIMNYMHDVGIRLDMSTNAGRPIDFSRVKSCENWYGILFSMPGFSQTSYDRIHRFDFEKVKDNIRSTMQAIRARGFHGYAMINFHLYQFNLGEVRAAKVFADELGLGLHTICAYFNGPCVPGCYLAETLSYADLKAASRDLLFFQIDELIAHKEEYFKKFREPEAITLSEHCNLLPSRASSDEERIKSIFDITSYDEIRSIYEQQFEKLHTDPQFGNRLVWGFSYKRSWNQTFGFEDNVLI